MDYLTREQILAVSDIDVADVEAPEWGGTLRVKGLDAKYVQGLFQSGFVNASGNADVSKLDFVDLAARSIVDENDKQMFSREQMKQMGNKSFGVISRIAQKALELSGLSSSEESDGDAEKNVTT